MKTRGTPVMNQNLEKKDNIQEQKIQNGLVESKKDETNIIDSKKIDLYINNNDNEENDGISIMNIFSFMRERFKIYIFVLLIAFLVGIIVPLLIYNLKDKKEEAIAVLGLDYENADEGLAPDGKKLDISYLKSSYIIQTALDNVVLTKNVGVSQVQSSLTITGVLTDETKQQQEVLSSLEELKSNEYAKLIQNFTLKYRAQYIITLNNSFKDGSKSFSIPSNELNHLLSAIIDAYSEYFNEVYQDQELPHDYISAIDEDTLDYLDTLDNIQYSLNYLEAYCNEKAGYISGFRGSDGLSFSDLASMIHTVKSNDIDYIYSYIYLNNISKDYYTQLNSYKYQKREAEFQLTEVNENIATTKDSIENYKKDSVVISDPNNPHPEPITVTGDYYNELVINLSDLNERKSSLEQRITVLGHRITVLEGPHASDEEIAKASLYVDSAYNNAQSIYNIVLVHSNELFNSNAYKSYYMHYITTSESESIMDNMKMFVIGAGAGLFIGLALWGCDALLLEIKRSKKNEEEEAQ